MKRFGKYIKRVIAIIGLLLALSPGLLFSHGKISKEKPKVNNKPDSVYFTKSLQSGKPLKELSSQHKITEKDTTDSDFSIEIRIMISL